MITYIIINTTETSKVDFNQVLQDSPSTLRLTCDGSQAILKWEGSEPSFVATLSSYEGPYTHSEILPMMMLPSWNCSVGPIPF